MKLNIPIPNDGAGQTEEIFDPLLSSEMTKFLQQVLASENGLKMTCHDHAMAVSKRQQYYIHRKKLLARGLMSFERIIIRIQKGSSEIRFLKQDDITVEKL